MKRQVMERHGSRFVLDVDTCRAAHEVPFGIALYDGQIIDGEFVGTHRGVVGDGDAAEQWLKGEDVKRTVIWSDADAAEARRLMGVE